MPRIPSEAEKVAALKRAYEINGNSMVGYNMMVDLTDPVMKGDKLAPDADPAGGIWPKPKPVEKRAEVQDICTRHNMHKSIRGKSWRCVR
jgi:hypothetical protein